MPLVERNPSMLRRILWVVFYWIGIGLVIAAMMSSKGFSPVGADPLQDPKTSQPLATSLLDTAAVSELTGQPMPLLMDWLPNTREFTQQGALAFDLRRLSFEQAWEREWFNPGTREGVTVVAVQYRHHDTPHTAPVLCDPLNPWNVPGATRAGSDSTDSWMGKGCAQADVGRVAVWISVQAVGDGSHNRVKTLLAAALARQLSTIKDSPDNPYPDYRSATWTSIQRGFLFATLGVALISVLRGLITDRSTWQAMAVRSRAGRVPRGSVDVTTAARYRRSKIRAVGAWRLVLVLWSLRLGEELNWDALPLFGLLAVAFVTGVLAQRWILDGTLKGKGITGIGWPGRIILGGGLMLALLLVTGAGTLWVTGNHLGSLGMFADLPDWFAFWVFLVMQWVAVLLLLLAFVPIALARRLALKTAAGRPITPGEYALLLRNFSDDYLEMRVRQVGRASVLDQLFLRRRNRFEEIEAISLDREGAVVAVGKPGERLPPGVGAQRLYFGSDWQQRVEVLMRDARLIVLNLGRSEALIWEATRLSQLGVLHKTVFVMPPVDQNEQRERLAALAEACKVPWHLLEPMYGNRHVLAVSLTFSQPYPLVLLSATQDDVSYDKALQIASRAVRIEPGSPAAQDAIPAPAKYFLEGGAGPTPPFRVLPPSEAKRKPRWWQHPWLLVILINVLILPTFRPVFTGDPLGQPARRQTHMPEARYINGALGGTQDAAYVIVDKTTVDKIDFSGNDDPEVVEIGELPRVPYRAIMDGDTIYWAAPQQKGASGEVGAWSIADARPLWSRKLGNGIPGLAVASGVVYVTSPVDNTLVALDARSGEQAASVSLPCQPWQVDVVDTSPWISCPMEPYSLRLDPEGLKVAEQVEVPGGAVEVLGYQGEPMVASAPARVMVNPRSTTTLQPATLYYSVAVPAMAARGGTLAIEGYERVSIFRGGYVERRQMFYAVTSIAILDDGSVLVCTTGSVDMIPVS
ncbi:MAG TPA: PQQ-binding-like beta-propeller repeat protein [Propionicimonas sp.]|nr:PQQ-binding-like beta-propeller repeat protein [Propionicimonas sp.]